MDLVDDFCAAVEKWATETAIEGRNAVIWAASAWRIASAESVEG